MPYYGEIAHIPFFIQDPRARITGERRQSLVQATDIAPTILEFFGQPIPRDMGGRPPRKTLEMGAKIRDYVPFDQHDVYVSITDEQYVYMRCPLPEREQEPFNYIVEPTSYPGAITVDELKTAELYQGFRSTEGCPVSKICGGYGTKTLGFPSRSLMKYGTLPFDLRGDPHQSHPLGHPEIEHRMAREIVRVIEENDAPEKQY